MGSVGLRHGSFVDPVLTGAPAGVATKYLTHSYGLYTYGLYRHGLYTVVTAYIIMAYIVMTYIFMTCCRGNEEFNI